MAHRRVDFCEIEKILIESERFPCECDETPMDFRWMVSVAIVFAVIAVLLVLIYSLVAIAPAEAEHHHAH